MIKKKIKIKLIKNKYIYIINNKKNERLYNKVKIIESNFKIINYIFTFE
jgi:hypothetical protein